MVITLYLGPPSRHACNDGWSMRCVRQVSLLDMIDYRTEYSNQVMASSQMCIHYHAVNHC